MRPLRKTWRSPRRTKTEHWIGVGIGIAGAVLVIKIVPLWIWPLGVGLWLVWSGLGPVIVGAAMIWIGWRLVSQR